MMSALWLDLRYALRMMAKSPGLTAVLAITLALGIGASTTIFSVVHSVVLSPLPYDEPDRIVAVYTEYHGAHEAKHAAISPAEYDDLRRACRSCEAVAMWSTGAATLSGGERPLRVRATGATHTLLAVLGVRPQLGRWFDAAEDRPGTRTVVVLGDGLWRRAFGADPAIVGRSIFVDAAPVTVIGVMPPGFAFDDRTEAWLPGGFDIGDHRANHTGFGLVRLAPGATPAGFQAELRALAARWAEGRGAREHHISPVEHPMIGIPLQADRIGSIATTLWLLQGAVLFVLAIAIVNIAGLLLARSESRTREVAVRHALGASRARLARQFITESVLLGALGGALGIVVAVWALDGVVALIPPSAPRADEIRLDRAAVAFAIACAFGAALLFGLAPILHARRNDLHGALKDGSPRTAGSRARLRVRRALVITEIALAIVLVAACIVMVRSFTRLQRTDLGFASDHLLTFELDLPAATYSRAGTDAFWHRLEEGLRAVPGATSVTLVTGLPTTRFFHGSGFSIVGQPDSDANIADLWQLVGTDALPTLGARLIRGRALLPSDTPDAPPVVLVNEAFAKKFFPGVDPIGRQLKLRAEAGAQTIVGIVGDMRQAGIEKPPGTEVFVPLWQGTRLDDLPFSFRHMTAVVRTAGDPMDLVPAVHRAVAALDPALPLSQVRTMDDVVWEAVARPRFLAFLLTGFAGLALLLAAVGIYGVMAHTVAQRTHEIGIRVALGARPGQVRLMILRQAGELVAIGAGIGLAAAVALQLALGAQLTGLFYGDDLIQPLLLAGVAAAVALTALLATWLPVRRATRIEPMAALRSE